MQQCFIKRKSLGQGVVEYAGALVVGGVLVSLALAVGPLNINNIVKTLNTNISSMFSANLSNIK